MRRGESAEDKIVRAIETSATTNDPSACIEFGTQHFNEQITGKEGKAAVKECEKSAVDEEGNAESADISNVEVTGSTATADVALTVAPDPATGRANRNPGVAHPPCRRFVHLLRG